MTLELALDGECLLCRVVRSKTIRLYLVCPLGELSNALAQALESQGLEDCVACAIRIYSSRVQVLVVQS